MHPHSSPTPQSSDDLTLLDVRQTAEILGLNERQAQYLFSQRVFPLVRLGRRAYVRRSVLVDYLDAQTEEVER